MPRFALTFDDGPGPSTAALLDLLREAGAKATFFLLGRNLAEAPWCGGDTAGARSVALRAAREGHLLGNHTYSHLKPGQWRDLAADLRRGEQVVRDLRREAGLPDGPVPLRLPYGIRLTEQTQAGPAGTTNAVTLDPRLAVIASMGLAHLHWTSDFDDWTLAAGDGPALASRMIAHIESNAALGLDAVLDLHDSGTGSSFGYQRPATVEGVRLLLAEAARRGWTSFTLAPDGGPGTPAPDRAAGVPAPDRRVTGIGGVFFKAKGDAAALRGWYRDHLGIELEEYGGHTFEWREPDGRKGQTVWSVFAAESPHLGNQPYMINYRVADLERLLAALRRDGVQVDEKTDISEYGKFGWVTDPEGNRVELWQPPAE